MKKFILTLLAGLSVSTASVQAGWFGSGEKERRLEAERQVLQQRKEIGCWQIATGVLAVSCVVLLTVGAAIGAKIRRDDS